MSRKCANENCSFRTCTEHDICSVCRQKHKTRHQCAHMTGEVQCENMCIAKFCRAHSHKLVQCAHLKPDGVQCTNMSRGELCHKHNEKNKAFRKKYNGRYVNPTKIKIRNREKRILVLQAEIAELKTLTEKKAE